MYENVKCGDLFILEARSDTESHIAVLFPHWDGGNVIVTGVKESRLFKAREGPARSAGTITLVEFLFEGRVYSENINNFLDRAKQVDQLVI